jgi:hypothetical protein
LTDRAQLETGKKEEEKPTTGFFIGFEKRNETKTDKRTYTTNTTPTTSTNVLSIALAITVAVVY